MSKSSSLAGEASVLFRHDALFYSGPEQIGDRLGGFVRDGLARDEDVLVMVTGDKIALLRSALGDDSSRVRFRDIAGVGRNPARIIPAWSDFFADAASAGRGVRGIAEPIWAGRTPDELVESQHHEDLINLAFGDIAGWLLCPYDKGSLDPFVVAEARRSHPFIFDGGVRSRSALFRGTPAIARPFGRRLGESGYPRVEFPFEPGPLTSLRRFVAEQSSALGLDSQRTSELLLAASEVAANALRHGGGRGTLRMWESDDTVVCEIRDAGLINAPLAGRVRPEPDDEGGFGLWLVNQVCDLVQIRTGRGGSVVRMHVARG